MVGREIDELIRTQFDAITYDGTNVWVTQKGACLVDHRHCTSAFYSLSVNACFLQALLPNSSPPRPLYKSC